MRRGGEKESERERERDKGRERPRERKREYERKRRRASSQPAGKGGILRTIDPGSSSTPALVSGNPSYCPRGPSCRRRGALRNVGATVGPAVPLTIPFSLCPPSRRAVRTCPGCHLG